MQSQYYQRRRSQGRIPKAAVGGENREKPPRQTTQSHGAREEKGRTFPRELRREGPHREEACIPREEVRIPREEVRIPREEVCIPREEVRIPREEVCIPRAEGEDTSPKREACGREENSRKPSPSGKTPSPPIPPFLKFPTRREEKSYKQQGQLPLTPFLQGFFPKDTGGDLLALLILLLLLSEGREDAKETILTLTIFLFL